MPFKLLPEEKPEPSVIDKIPSAIRVPAQIGKEVGATIAGLPGDVFNLLNEFISRPMSEKVTGKKSVPYEETFLGKILPTSAKHRENLEKGIPLLNPKNKMEKFISDVSSDTASLFLPIKTKIPFKNTLTKAFSTSLGSNLFGEIVGDLTGDEKKKSYSKMGSLFTLSLLNKPAAAKYVGELYNKAENLLPKNAAVNAIPLERSMDSLRNKVLSQRSYADLAPSEKFVIEEANKISRNIHNGQMNVATAWAAKRSLNENLEKILLETPNKASQQRARKLSLEINHSLRNILKDYGKQNPEFYKNFTSAEEAFSVLAQSNKMSKFIENNLKYSPITAGLIHFINGPLLTKGAAAIAPYQAWKTAYRIVKSPTLRKYYTNVMKSAAKEDSVVFNKELNKLDNLLKKEEKKSKKKFKLVN